MDADELERIVRRVVREELALSQAHGARRVVTLPAAPRRGRRTREDEEQGIENMRMVNEYLQQLDPDGRLTREEVLQAMRLRFPHFGL